MAIIISFKQFESLSLEKAKTKIHEIDNIITYQNIQLRLIEK